MDVTAPATFVNFLRIRRALVTLPEGVDEVVVDYGASPLVDHTFQEKLALVAEEWEDASLRVVGLDALRPRSEHPFATRVRAR